MLQDNCWSRNMITGCKLGNRKIIRFYHFYQSLGVTDLRCKIIAGLEI